MDARPSSPRAQRNSKELTMKDALPCFHLERSICDIHVELSFQNRAFARGASQRRGREPRRGAVLASRVRKVPPRQVSAAPNRLRTAAGAEFLPPAPRYGSCFPPGGRAPRDKPALKDPFAPSVFSTRGGRP